MRKKILVLAVFSGFLMSCGSMAKRAKEQMEQGDYSGAASTYEQILSRDSKDPEAKAGLKAARAGVLQTRLIQVRKARQGADENGALELLLGTLALEKKWNMAASGNAAFTQEEEMGFAVKTAAGHVESALKEEFPLKAEAELRRTEPVFQGKNMAMRERLVARAREMGGAQCREQQKSDLKAMPYYAQFVIRFCDHWKASTASLNGRTGDRAEALFKGIKFTPSIEGLPKEQLPLVEEAALQALKSSAWYDASGKHVLDVSVSGRYERDDDKVQITMVHTYEEAEKYVDYEDVTKKRKVPRLEVYNVTDPATGAVKSEQRTVYVNESYTERQPVEKTRYVSKSFPFGAWKLARRINLDFTFLANVGDQALSASVQSKLNEEDHEHTIKMPGIGLKPHKAKLTDPTDFLKGRLTETAGVLQQKLSGLWGDMYCHASSNPGGMAEAGDQVFKCLRMQQAQVPAYAEEWHRTHLGLDAKAAQELLAL